MHKTNIWKRGGALAYLSSHCTKAVRHDSESGRCGGEEVQDNGDEARVRHSCARRGQSWRICEYRHLYVHRSKDSERIVCPTRRKKYHWTPINDASLGKPVVLRHACGGCHHFLMEVAV